MEIETFSTQLKLKKDTMNWSLPGCFNSEYPTNSLETSHETVSSDDHIDVLRSSKEDVLILSFHFLLSNDSGEYQCDSLSSKNSIGWNTNYEAIENVDSSNRPSEGETYFHHQFKQ